MRNIKMIVEYNGSLYHGWQRQDGLRTIQGELENALKTVTGESAEIEGSGRTDKGVHALGQVASFNLNCNIPLPNLRVALNNRLEKDIRVLSIEEVDADFHARFSTKKKTYEYVVQLGVEQSVFSHNLVACWGHDVDMEKVKKVLPLLIGSHNFKGFCSSDTNVTNFERTIFDLTVRREGDKLIFDVAGNGFLYNMVRIIVGTILDVGRGILPIENVVKALENGDRTLTGQTMPACGLYLKKVDYDAEG